MDALTKFEKKAVKLVSNLVSNRRKRKALNNYLTARLKIGLKEKLALLRYLERYYAKLDLDGGPVCANVDVRTLPVWQLWLQGRDAAPPLVQKCMHSVAGHVGGREVVALTEADLPRYIQLPDYIWEKYRRGMITRTHLSDIVRVCLLAEHGGTWMDATILLTAPLPDVILDADFFAFTVHKDNFRSEMYLMESWFLSAKPNHAVMRAARQVLFAYWQTENELKDYFLFHMLMKGMLTVNAPLRSLWDKTPHLSDQPCYALQRNFLEPFDTGLLAAIEAGTPVHKLSYFRKYIQNPPANTFLETFMQGQWPADSM